MYILYNKFTEPRVENNKKCHDTLGDVKHYPPASKEWFDSVYAYNKNTTKLLPLASTVVLKLIKNYFNCYNLNLERKIRSPKLRKWMRRLSSTRILISKAELKHTSDKVIVTVYVYNRQEKYYINKLKKLSNLLRFNDQAVKFIHLKARFTRFLVAKKDMLMSTLHVNKALFTRYEKNNFIRYTRKCLKHEMRHLHILQVMLMNKFKFKDLYLPRLSHIIENVYNKNVEFNFVNQKYFYLNSDILLQILAMKLRKRLNVVKVLTTTINGVNTFNLTKLEVLRGADTKYLLEQNDNNSHLIRITNDIKNDDTDLINNKLEKCFFLNKKKLLFSDLDNKNKSSSYTGLEDAVLNCLKHKSLSGIRLEATGRLTRRITAARSIYKVKYLGNLRNLDSSSLGRSTTILRGNLRPNLQVSKLKSKTRIGSFGLKGWINGI